VNDRAAQTDLALVALVAAARPLTTGVDQHQEVVVQQVAAVGARSGASVPSR
jgi:hypothetical protein